MNLHIVAPDSIFRLNDHDCAAAARRRRRKLFLLFALTALSWLLIGTLVLSVA